VILGSASQAASPRGAALIEISDDPRRRMIDTMSSISAVI